MKNMTGLTPRNLEEDIKTSDRLALNSQLESADEELRGQLTDPQAEQWRDVKLYFSEVEDTAIEVLQDSHEVVELVDAGDIEEAVENCYRNVFLKYNRLLNLYREGQETVENFVGELAISGDIHEEIGTAKNIQNRVLRDVESVVGDVTEYAAGQAYTGERGLEEIIGFTPEPELREYHE